MTSNIQPILVQIAQSAAQDLELLAAIGGAYTEFGRNELEQCLRLRLPLEEQGTSDRCDLVSDFFTIFG